MEKMKTKAGGVSRRSVERLPRELQLVARLVAAIVERKCRANSRKSAKD